MYRSEIESLVCDPSRVTVQAVTGASPETLALLTRFLPHEKPTARLALTSDSAVTFALPPKSLGRLEVFGARVFVWAVGPGSTFAPYSDFYARPALRKVKLWRLGPDYHGGEGSFTAGEGPWTLSLSPPAPLTVARLMVVPFAHFSPYTVIDTPKEAPEG